jgi:hypothetical protein
MAIRQRGRGGVARGDPSGGSWCGVGAGISASGQPQREVEADRWAAIAHGAHQAVAHRERERERAEWVHDMGRVEWSGSGLLRRK